MAPQASSDASGVVSKRQWAAGFLPPFGGVLGAGGVAVSAAAAHLGGSSLAVTAGAFLLLHAVAVFALAALDQMARDRRYVIAGGLLGLGVVFFSGDLALAGLYGWRPFPPAAPIGGLLLIAGWLAVPMAALVGLIRMRLSP